MIANENNTSRKFVRQQGHNLQVAIDNVFDIDSPNNDNVIYDLPVTKVWIEQLVLALMLIGQVSYRNIIAILKDLLDYDISLGTLNNIFNAAVERARAENAAEDLSNIEVTANDELFHRNKPILAGIDTRSLYCYLLSAEDRRDEETWAIHLMDTETKGLKPQRTICDDARGLVSGHWMVFPQVFCEYDHFHISRALMDLRRYFRNRLKTAITALNRLESKAKKSPSNTKLIERVLLARTEEASMRHISETTACQISWLEHDILNKAGPTPEERRELYDFVVDEFKKLEVIEAHRIKPVRITLEKKREMILRFSDVLADKLKLISHEFAVSVDTIWSICKLQRCDLSGDQYFFRSLPLQAKLEERFDEIEDAVIQALATTERTSSMVENLNGRVRGYIRSRQEIGFGYLDLLRFFMNHSPIVRSARPERKGKSPAEILLGKPHPHWLEMLGFERFKRTAYLSLVTDTGQGIGG